MANLNQAPKGENNIPDSNQVHQNRNAGTKPQDYQDNVKPGNRQAYKQSYASKNSDAATKDKRNG